MSEHQQQVDDVNGVIEGLPIGVQKAIRRNADELHRIVRMMGPCGDIALALVGAERALAVNAAVADESTAG